MVIVIIKGRAANVMLELEYNGIIVADQKFRAKNI